ncbi:putative nicotinate-nucleotide adenylyltransferase [Mycobacterium xenopi 3993]|nr:putative nicotinate-nucleotide adenylyltransferase [Mycobacterium xenopi 3993]
MPTGQPWQKDRHVSAAEDRYLMTVIATASNPRFSVSRVDIDRGGPPIPKTPCAICMRSTRTPSCTSSPAPTH